MIYTLSYKKPHTQFLDIELTIENNKKNKLEVNLPVWRPGRYELGNFAKNIQKFSVCDEKGEAIKFRKTSKSSWQIEAGQSEKIIIKYNYYSSELNAGSTWLDETQLYVNPVNCFLYLPSRMDESCFLKLDVPQDYKVATSLEKIDEHLFKASDFHELADSPFIASNSLAQTMFIYEGIEFHLWFQGLKKPDFGKLINDFFLFTHEQYLIFNDFPAQEYHYFFQILPYKAYHGVEHLKSTVVTLGPAHAVMHGIMYNELLGVSSHELFHAWNIKSIRPVEMLPYDYGKENYSRLGFVYEGITTYYGDLMLYRSGVFTQQEYFQTFNEQLQKHFDNFGRLNLSVGDSSFDTWLDGYVPGIPDRKTSIYTEGCLLAFITDILIRQETANERSLDDIMRILYTDFAKKSKGYSEDDYLKIVSSVAGKDMSFLFEEFAFGTKSMEIILQECLQKVGCELVSSPSYRFHENRVGFKAACEQGRLIIKSVFTGSPADEAGLKINDEIIAINDTKVMNDLDDLLRYSESFSKNIALTLWRGSMLKKASVTLSQKSFYRNYRIGKVKEPASAQAAFFEKWTKQLLNSAV